jgi:hypothetical protein
MVTGGQEGDPPDNWPVIAAAKYWGVPPWEMMKQSLYWVRAADDVAEAERHRDEVRARQKERARKSR